MTVSSQLEHVRAQYEALPYPARDPRDEAIRLITGTPSHVLEINHYLFSGRLNFIRPFRALVAGGGTGDACIMLAQQLVDRRCPGEVFYLDLSTASRQICEARAKARGLRNIQFLTGSLLDLAIEKGVLEKRGSWLSYKGNQLAQGRDAAKEALKADAALYAEIETEIRAALDAEKK
jgi:hypothetical protein